MKNDNEINKEFKEPLKIQSTNGLLEYTLNLDYFNYKGPDNIEISTRALGGSIPGPTFVV